MIKKVPAEIRLDEINFANEEFRFSIGEPPKLLADSIKSYGVLVPPWVISHSDDPVGYRILTGFRRLEAAKLLGLEKVLCLLIENYLSHRDLFLMALNERVGKRELNPAEKALVVGKSEELLGVEKSIRRVLPLIGLEPSEKIFAQYLAISRLGKRVLEALSRDEISQAAALELTKVKEQGRKRIVEVVTTLGCSSSIQKEIVIFCREIAAREKIPVEEIFEDTEVEKILWNQELNRREKTALVRDYLRKRRYPMLVKCEREFQEQLKNLSFPAGATIKAPQYFEGNRWTLEVVFRNEKELREKISAIENVVKKENIAGLINLSRG